MVFEMESVQFRRRGRGGDNCWRQIRSDTALKSLNKALPPASFDIEFVLALPLSLDGRRLLRV